MKRILVALTIAVLPAVAHAASCPRDNRSTQGVLSVERRWVDAIEKRNAAALDCILDPTFADTSWRGDLVPRDEVLKRISARPPSTLELTQLRATQIENVAIVRGVNTQSTRGQVVGSVRFVDVLVYRAGRWRAVSAQESLIQPR